MTTVVHLSWPSTVDDRGSEWLSLGRAPDGSWWFAALYAGRWAIDGGTPQVAAFAQWLLEPPPAGRYEKEFFLLDEQSPNAGSSVCPLTVHVLLGRENAGGPEYLVVYLDSVGLEWESVERNELEAAATMLLDATNAR